jgi:hypothetical protein
MAGRFKKLQKMFIAHETPTFANQPSRKATACREASARQAPKKRKSEETFSVAAFELAGRCR